MLYRLLSAQNRELGHLTTLPRKIEPAVQAALCEGAHSATNYAFVDAVARKNVELTIEHIRAHSSVLRELEEAGAIKIVGAMYDIETALIDFLYRRTGFQLGPTMSGVQVVSARGQHLCIHRFAST